MNDIQLVTIDKTDVLTESFSNIKGLVQMLAEDKEKLYASRNTWEVTFWGYDEDPREIPEIPEVVNWIKKSVEEGIPWFYFMRADRSSYGLLTFMVCCCADRDGACCGRYVFERDRVMEFIKKNFDNLADFVEAHDIPDELGRAATDDITNRIQTIVQGTSNGTAASTQAIREKQRKEAGIRLAALEKLYGLNPKVKKYFENGKLYYSYLTAGGYIASIDTIDDDKSYAALVKSFEEQTGSLVYHVIERNNTISVLFVSDNYDNWPNERPTVSGVPASVINTENYENKTGFIKIDCLQGALYRINDMVYPDNNGFSASSDVDSEIIERLEIMKNLGIETDIDIADVYAKDGEICFSMLQTVFGIPVAVVNRISAKSVYVELLNLLREKTEKRFYFLMGSTDHYLAFLYISDVASDWEAEKQSLENKTANAVIVDIEKMTAELGEIRFDLLNGGPIFIAD